MSTNIYQEAIAEAKKLRDIAEQNATNKIVEAVAPRIRRLIEAELAADDDFEDEGDIDISDFGADSPDESALPDDLDNDPLNLDPSVSSGVSISPPSEPAIDSPGLDSLPELEDEETEEKDVTVNITVENSRKSNLILQTVRVKSLVRQLRESKNSYKRAKILKQLSGLSKKLVISSNILEQKLGKQISNILKESNMSGRTRRPNRRLRENTWWMFEGDEAEELDLDLEDEGADEVDEEGGEEELDVAAVEAAVEDLAGALGMEVVPAEEGAEEEGAEEEGAEEEGEEEELDLDLEEWQMYEADEEEAGPTDEVYISEAALRRELARMKRPTSRRNRRPTRNTNRRRRMSESEARDAADNFGGGKAEQEMFIDVDENTLLNALAEELGDAHSVNQNTNSPEGGAEKVADNFGGGSAQKALPESIRRRRARARRAKINESRRNGAARKQVLAARKEAQLAKRELKESNLFNAKLLYVNKLMQQHDLNSKQQRAIVEALDNAKTLREAKLLYTSLTDSLRRRSTAQSKSAGRSLNEGTLLRSGSGSNSTRSGAPAKSGVELDRWAVLAGIKK